MFYKVKAGQSKFSEHGPLKIVENISTFQWSNCYYDVRLRFDHYVILILFIWQMIMFGVLCMGTFHL